MEVRTPIPTRKFFILDSLFGVKTSCNNGLYKPLHLMILCSDISLYKVCLVFIIIQSTMKVLILQDSLEIVLCNDEDILWFLLFHYHIFFYGIWVCDSYDHRTEHMHMTIEQSIFYIQWRYWSFKTMVLLFHIIHIMVSYYYCDDHITEH